MANTKVPIELSSTPGIVDNSTATAITIDSAGAATFSGNLGIGVVPSAWASGWKAMELGFGSFGGYPTTQLYITSNAYNNGTSWIYKTTSQAAQYLQYQGSHIWSSAASGTAGAAASFTTNMVLDTSGNLTSTGNIIIDSPAGNPILNIIAAGGGGAAEVRLQTTGYTSAIYQYQGSVYHSTAAVRPATDNTTNLGGAAHRWNIIYCTNNVINTSDAREKTVVAKLTANEIEASKLLGKEIGTYKWLASIEEKGEGARTHIGMTVQRAIEIMKSCDLDPMAYGFICYDEWEDDIAVEQPAIEAQDAVLDEDGKVVTPAIKAVDEITKTHALAGNRYGFRYDQLNQFIAAGFNARLEALEGA